MIYVLVLLLSFFASGQESTLSVNVSSWASLDCAGTVTTQTVGAEVCLQVSTNPNIYGSVNCDASAEFPQGYSFLNDIWPLLQEHAFPGHTGSGGGVKYLQFFSDNSFQGYQTLLNSSSRENKMKYITPFQPENSYLFHKITNTQSQVNGSGMVMPPSGIMSNSIIDIFEQWILQGAIYIATPQTEPWKMSLFSDNACSTPFTNLPSINGTNETQCSNANLTASKRSFKIQCFTQSPPTSVPSTNNTNNTNTNNNTNNNNTNTDNNNNITKQQGPGGSATTFVPLISLSLFLLSLSVLLM